MDRFDPSNAVYLSDELKGSKRVSMLDLLDYFESAGLMRVSDLHLKVGQPPWYRIDGKLRRIKGDPLDQDTLRQLVFGLLSKEDRAQADQREEVDASYPYKNYQFRIHVYRDSKGMVAAIRALPLDIPKVEELGFPNNIWKDIVHRGSGLVLVTGITGAGKSTTIASLIERINKTRQCRIITLEDPIEYVFEEQRSLVSQREIGRDVKSFEDGLRCVTREDPDVIFVGEMRDAESVSWTLTAAETGHLVFSTLHTRDTVGSITRILDFFPSKRRRETQNQLSLGLACVISQKLIPRNDGEGRVLAMEILNNTYGVANLIRSDHLEQIYSVIQTHGADKHDGRMITLEASIARLVRNGVVDRKEATRWVNKLDVFEGSMQRRH